MTLLHPLPSIGKAAPWRFHKLDPAVWPTTDAIDEADFRRRARRYRKTLREAAIVYVGEPPLTTAVARWAREAGLGIGVRSPGELATALAGGTNPNRIVVHGNAVSPEELRDAVAAGVGRIVVDSDIEIAYLAGLARRPQRVLVRMSGDQAVDAASRVLAHPILDLIGLHCHVGSQVADPTPYGETIRRTIAAMADIRAAHGVILTELNIGARAELSGERLAAVIDDALDEACAAEHFPRPAVVVEHAL